MVIRTLNKNFTVENFREKYTLVYVAHLSAPNEVISLDMIKNPKGLN